MVILLWIVRAAFPVYLSVFCSGSFPCQFNLLGQLLFISPLSVWAAFLVVLLSFNGLAFPVLWAVSLFISLPFVWAVWPVYFIVICWGSFACLFHCHLLGQFCLFISLSFVGASLPVLSLSFFGAALPFFHYHYHIYASQIHFI